MTKTGIQDTATRLVQTPKEKNTSSGKIDSTIPTVDTSGNSPKSRKPVKKNTPGSPRPGRKINPEARLSIVQSALARLGESGVEVFAREEGDNLIITIIKVGITDKKFVLK